MSKRTASFLSRRAALKGAAALTGADMLTPVAASGQTADRRIILSTWGGDLSPLGSAWELEHKLFVLTMSELGAEAERLGVILAIEPLNRYLVKFLQTVAHAKRICAEVGSPALKILIDNFQSYHKEVTVEGAIRDAGALVGHVHISDNTRRLPPQGSIDFRPVISALRAVEYKGFLSFECEVAGAELSPQFEAAVNHMRSLM